MFKANFASTSLALLLLATTTAQAENPPACWKLNGRQAMLGLGSFGEAATGFTTLAFGVTGQSKALTALAFFMGGKGLANLITNAGNIFAAEGIPKANSAIGYGGVLLAKLKGKGETGQRSYGQMGDHVDSILSLSTSLASGLIGYKMIQEGLGSPALVTTVAATTLRPGLQYLAGAQQAREAASSRAR
jgi:hypothetical protein